MRLFLQALCAICISFSMYSADKLTPPMLLPEPGPTTVSAEWQSLQEKKGVKEWLISCLDDPHMLQPDEHLNKLTLLSLFEDKGNNDRFDRKVSGVRQLVEKAIVDDIEAAMMGQPKDAPVRILSLGSIGFLQEFFLVGQLVKQGRTYIEVTLVNHLDNKQAVQGFNKLCTALAEEGVRLNLRTFANIAELQKQISQPFHAGYCTIATEKFFCRDLICDVVQARKLIANKGHFFFSQLDGTVAFSADAGVHVLEMTQKAQVECNTITATQLNSQRPKDRTIRIVVGTSNDLFFFGPLFYAVSDLLDNGYSDIFVSIMGRKAMPISDKNIISQFFDTINTSRSSPLTFQWRPKNYIGNKVQYRKDLIIYWYDNLELKDKVEVLNKEIIMCGSSLPDNGYCIIYGKDLGLWTVDGRRSNVTAVTIPEDKKLLATAMIQDILGGGHPWWK